MTDALIDVDQKIPDWLIRITFLSKVQTAIRKGVTSSVGILGFGTRDAVLGLWFFLWMA